MCSRYWPMLKTLPIAEMDYYDLSPTPPVFQHRQYSNISTSLQAKFAIQRENCQTCLSNPERKQIRPKIKLDRDS